MKKIAFLNIYQGKVRRGAETFVSELSKRLKKDFTVDVIEGGKTLPNRWPVVWRTFLDPQGICVLLFTLKCIPKLWREKYDVIIPVNGGWMPAVVRIVTWLYKGKMVISGQSGMGWDEKNNLWCFPDCFVALSNQAEKQAKRVNPFVKLLTIPNGVDIKIFSPNGKKYPLNLSHPIVLCVAALTKTKRIDLVIKAVEKIKNASLVVVGNPEDSEHQIKLLASKLLNKRFKLLTLKHQKMPQVYRSADIFTLVSEPYYSFEIAIIEAMSTNLPVVVNNDPIRKEIVGDAGVFVDPTNDDSYAQSIDLALKKNWGGKSRERAREFSWDKIATEYNRLIKNLVN